MLTVGKAVRSTLTRKYQFSLLIVEELFPLTSTGALIPPFILNLSLFVAENS